MTYVGREHAVPCREYGCPSMTWRIDAYCERHTPGPRISPRLAAGRAMTVGLRRPAVRDRVAARRPVMFSELADTLDALSRLPKVGGTASLKPSKPAPAVPSLTFHPAGSQSEPTAARRVVDRAQPTGPLPGSDASSGA